MTEVFCTRNTFEVSFVLCSRHGNCILFFRTKLCNCQSDAEYLAKLHCLRLAFTVSGNILMDVHCVIYRHTCCKNWTCLLGPSNIQHNVFIVITSKEPVGTG